MMAKEKILILTKKLSNKQLNKILNETKNSIIKQSIKVTS